jgi:NitT/TauT family transport system ATP-binding protein
MAQESIGAPISESLLDVRDVTKSFNIGPLRQLVLEHCSFSIEAGRLTVLIGPSGCGKTTIVNILAGYERVDAGEVYFLGKPVRGPASDRLVVFQESALFPWMTTYQNIIYGPVVMHWRHRGGCKPASGASRANGV